MVHYKLTYFSVKGLGEQIRLILSYGGKPFEDNRVEFDDSWNSLKQKTLFGQLPILEIDGKTEIYQSRAICRYLAKQFGIAGKDDIEQAQADMYVDGLYDIYPKGQAYFGELRKKVFENKGDDEKIKQEFGKWKTEAIVPFLDILEKVLAKNGSGHLVGSKVTWADIVIAEWAQRVGSISGVNIVENHPNVAKLAKTVLDLPGIKEYIEKRPQTNL